MPHDLRRTATMAALGVGLLCAFAPTEMRAQVAVSMSVSATVLSAQAMRSWQAVAERLHETAPTGPAAAAPAALALIAERTESSAEGARRIVTVEYLRN